MLIDKNAGMCDKMLGGSATFTHTPHLTPEELLKQPNQPTATVSHLFHDGSLQGLLRLYGLHQHSMRAPLYLEYRIISYRNVS